MMTDKQLAFAKHCLDTESTGFHPEVLQVMKSILSILEHFRARLDDLMRSGTTDPRLEDLSDQKDEKRSVGITVENERMGAWQLALRTQRCESKYLGLWKQLDASTEMHVGNHPRPYFLVGRKIWESGKNCQIGGAENSTSDFFAPLNVAKAVYYTPEGREILINVGKDMLSEDDQERLGRLIQAEKTPIVLLREFEGQLKSVAQRLGL